MGAFSLDLLKGRVAEALVEGILIRSGYCVCRAGRESQVQQLLKLNNGRGEARNSGVFPDFLVWKAVGNSSVGSPLYRLISIEVKYCSNVERSLREYGDALPTHGGWPELYAVLVTDAAAARSHFQVVDLRSPGAPLITVDLHEFPELRISERIAKEYEGFVEELFRSLTASQS